MLDETDTSIKTAAKIVAAGPWLHAWYDPLAGESSCQNMSGWFMLSALRNCHICLIRRFRTLHRYLLVTSSVLSSLSNTLPLSQLTRFLFDES